jgi:HK97 gp10 family phage protein
MTDRMFGFALQKGRKFDAEMRRLKTTPKTIEKVVRDELITMAIGIRNHIIRSMKSTPRITRLKTMGTSNAKNPSGDFNWMVGGKLHIPSSPGYAPASVHGGTGMMGSIKKDVRQNEVEVGSRLNAKSNYPKFLEFGTKNMDARPWLEPAFIDEKREFYSTIRNNILRAIRKAR